MNITAFDRPNLKVLRTAIDAALKSVADEYGISLAAGNAKYAPDGSTVTFKLEGAVKTAMGEVASKEASYFKQYATMHGLTPEHLNKTFVSRGETYKLIGYNPKAPKRCFIIEDTRGKRFVCPEEMIQRAFGVKSSTPTFTRHLPDEGAVVPPDLLGLPKFGAPAAPASTGVVHPPASINTVLGGNANWRP